MRARPTLTVVFVVYLGIALVPAAAWARSDATPAGPICSVIPAPGATPAGTESARTPAAVASPDLATVPFDLAFIDLMIPALETEVVMAEIGREQATRPEVRGLMDATIATQPAEIAQLEAWRAAWYPDVPVRSAGELTQIMAAYAATMLDATPIPSMVGTDAGTEVTALCAAATDTFDLALIDRLLARHEAAVAMANVALEQAEHPELKAFALAVIDTQSREIDEMQTWRAAWS